jgi:transcriptional regulator with XRE-family HTH domain
MSLKMRIRVQLDKIGSDDKELAKKLGITKSMLSKRMNGYIEFSHSQIDTMLEMFDCKYEDVFSE